MLVLLMVFQGDQHVGSMYTAHESGLNLTASYINAADAVTDVSYSDYGVTYTGMEGLTIGYGKVMLSQTTGTKSDESTMFAKYAIGGFATVGIQNQSKTTRLHLM